MSALIIAEAGVNHNGDMALAQQLVDAAAEAGADLVKFQTFSADRIVTRSAAKADYQNCARSEPESQYQMLHGLELSREHHERLIECCRAAGIGFLSTGFDIESIDLLIEFGINRLKIPSGEITNFPHLRHIGALGKEVMLSTGMANLGEVEAALEVLEAVGTPRERITVLHCTSEYPAPIAEVNLRAMVLMGRALGVAVGYSDHTQGIEIPIAAAALGASVIEKHFTLDRSLPGPDHKASLEPDELKAMVQGIRNVEKALGDGVKRITPSERENRPVVRKSIVAARYIGAGERFTEDNIAVKRPGTGLSPMEWDRVIGRAAPRDFAADELIEL